ncbi:MAG: chemotaxis protein CheA [Candidatus Omnitrophica bacterium]|nr:chemotaxis protein CheA [Candidatus Omnitrophota bacterium]
MVEDDQDKVPEDLIELLPEFLSESDDHMQVLNDMMLQLEDSVKDGVAMSTDDMNTMFRSAHTIKGTASFIGLTRVVDLTHKTETLLQKLRDGEMTLTQNIVDALFSAIDTLTSLLVCLKEKGVQAVDITADVKQLESILIGEDVPAKEEQPRVVETPQKEVPVEKKPAASVNKKYLEQFIVEAEQNIEDFNELLMAAEKDQENISIVDDIFRIMHTIKGSSGIVGADAIGTVAHRMENILGICRERKTSVGLDVTALMFKGIDIIKEIVESLKNKGVIDVDVGEISKEMDDCLAALVSGKEIVEKKEGKAITKEGKEDIDLLTSLTRLSENEKAVLVDAVNKGCDVFRLSISIEEGVSVKCMKVAIIEERLKKKGVVVLMRPSMAAFESDDSLSFLGMLFCSAMNAGEIRQSLSLEGATIEDVEWIDKKELADILPAPEKEIKEEIIPDKKVQGIKKGSAMTMPEKTGKSEKKEVKAPSIEISTIKIDSRKLDTLMTLSGELVIIRAQYARLVGLFKANLVEYKEIVRINEETFSLVDDLKKEVNAAALGSDAGDDGKGVARVKKILSEISGMMEMLDQSIKKSDIVENIHTLDETTGALEKVSSNMQSGVMQTRMVPVEGVFTRFKRIVRDVSKDIGKQVELELVGSETELDKKIVDSLADPLTHMIRNAVDHAIEDEETREKYGKPPVGKVILKASHKGNNICIEVKDDGAGIDPEKLAAVALKKELLTQEQIEHMNEKEKLNILFMPGFSSAEKVTGLSGRGVGMDVVKNMVTSVNGTVDIDTRMGEGTNFILRIPLTLAIIQSLLVKIGGEIYAFPLDTVTEIIKVSNGDIYTIDGNATVKLRDHALSLIELGQVIALGDNNNRDEMSKKVVIITDGESRLGVIVDSLVGKDEIVIKSFTDHFANVKGVTGASILADGTISLILDPIMIIKESK